MNASPAARKLGLQNRCASLARKQPRRWRAVAAGREGAAASAGSDDSAKRGARSPFMQPSRSASACWRLPLRAAGKLAAGEACDGSDRSRPQSAAAPPLRTIARSCRCARLPRAPATVPRTHSTELLLERRRSCRRLQLTPNFASRRRRRGPALPPLHRPLLSLLHFIQVKSYSNTPSRILYL